MRVFVTGASSGIGAALVRDPGGRQPAALDSARS